MGVYILRRLVLAILVIFGVTLITFVIARLVPGDPAALYAGPRPTTAQVNVVRGDWGISFKTHQPIGQDLVAYVPPTLELVLAGSLVALLGGVILGVLAGASAGSGFDRVCRVMALSGVAMPVFWLGLILQLVFFRWLDWLPLAGRVSNDILLFNPIERVTGLNLIDAALMGNWEGWRDAALHLVLPAFVLALYPLAVTFRMMRAAMIETLSEPFILAARARGVSRLMLLFRHSLKHALVPSLNVLGMSLVYSLTGAVLVELIFAWPGLGRYVTEAILTVDFPVIIAMTLLMSIAYSLINLATDIAQALLDPRILLK